MFKTILLATSTALLSVSAFASANITGVPKGNGVIVDSAATDIYCQNNQSVCKSTLNYTPLLSTLDKLKPVTIGSQSFPAGVRYIFPDIGYIRAYAPGSETAATWAKNVFAVCPVHSNTQQLISSSITYYAKPQVSEIDGFGSCMVGAAVTKAYAQNNYKVIPMFSYSGNVLQSVAKADVVTVATALAASLASLINADPNAAGVAIDNEPAIERLGPKANQKDPAVLAAFFGTLANALNAHSKYLFIYDAGDLQGTGITKNHNVVVLQSMYGLGTAPQNNSLKIPAYQATLASVKNRCVNNSVINPTMYVVPASATDNLWSSAQIYNYSSNAYFAKDGLPKYNIYPYKIAESSACDQQLGGATYYQNLGQFICNPQNVNSPYPGCIAGSTAVKLFFNYELPSNLAKNSCYKFPNPNTAATANINLSMLDYFNASLQTVAACFPASHTVNNALGVVLYTVRVPVYNDLAAAVHFYSTDGSVALLKPVWLTFPASVLPVIWNSFINWPPIRDNVMFK